MKTIDILQAADNQPSAAVHQPDHEVQMARSELYRAGKCAIELHNMLKRVSEQEGLEGWVQSKITKAADYLESVYHYLDYEMKNPGEVDEASPVSPASVPAGGVTTPGDAPKVTTTAKANDPNASLMKAKAAAAVALQKKQIQDQIRATQLQLQNLQKQLQSVGAIAQSQPMAEMGSAGASVSGGMSVAPGAVRDKKKVGSLFGGSYKQGAAESSVLDKHFGTVPGPDVEHDKQRIRALLTQMMGKLPARYERVLRMRYFQDMTLRQIADKINVNSERVRQIEAKALRMLKQPNRRPSNRTLGGALDAYSDVHEDLNEIKKGEKDANGYTKCWPGKHAEGTKKGKNGGRVRNCVPNESVAEGKKEYGVRYKVFAGREGRLTTKEYWTTSSEKLEKAVAKIKDLGNFYEIDGYSYPNEDVKEAGGAAQQAAIAIAKKESGKYDKDGKRIREEHDKSHLGPYDCGGADSWYGRRFNPHKYVDLPNGTRQKVELTDPKEIAAYKAGYEAEGGQGKNYSESVAEGSKTGPKFTGYWKGKDKGKPGKKMVGDA